ncbi:hypothetical protein [Corynebacterium sp. KPL3806]|uniref:hypothetical protein n=1 Tax=unclassified Corynebacterium TaxID=2624378 RepID=UPI002051EC0B|nr:MAG TPA: hypothetical protein [Caudoviricetes sp.]
MGQLNPTRQEIIDAHNALEELKNAAWNAAEYCSDTVACALWEKRILAALPPKPQPTMADVEWDDDEHHLAEAEDEHGIRMIMVSDELDFIRCMQPPSAGGIVLGVPKKDLTPTGRRYVLQEGE